MAEELKEELKEEGDAPLFAAPRACPVCPESDDDEPLECRICRGEAEPGRELFVPCKCRGSIMYCHEECLVSWLARRAALGRCMKDE